MQAKELIQQLSPTVRRYVYMAFAMVSLGLGTAQVGFASAGMELPLWLIVTVSCFSFIGAQVGIIAASNVGAAEVEVDDRHEASTEYSI